MTPGDPAQDKAMPDRDAAHDSPIVRTGDVVQNAPAMDMNDTTTSERVDGIVAQTRADHAADGQERIIEVLKQRFDQAGIELTDDEVAELARG
jgi:hypothetical protein